jgi:hypothetical protein
VGRRPRAVVEHGRDVVAGRRGERDRRAGVLLEVVEHLLERVGLGVLPHGDDLDRSRSPARGTR